MDNNQILYQLLLQQLAQNEQGNSIDKLKSYSSKLNNFGDNLSTVGNTIKNNIDSKVAKKLGSSMLKIGGNLSNGASSLSNTLNAPQNYYKGFANRALGTGLQNVGQTLAGQSGAIGTIGNVLSKTGATMAGTTAAGTGAATAGTATTGAAAGSGAATGGAAAGGSGAGAAAGPIAALAAMALMGTNRKRAKKSSQALMQSTNQMAEVGNQESDQRLTATQQSTQALQDAANQSLMNGVMTGGAAPVKTNPISDYQDYLRQNGYSDEVINGVPQGLNYGNKDIADWINQYNSDVGRNTPINIPQTEEEIAAAKAGNFNVPTQSGGVYSDVKQGILDKFINGITDFSRGYQENRNTAFSPDNLKADKNKRNMQKVGEAFGTVGRMVQNPATQALIAGGISTALTGNPLYGAGVAYKFGNKRAMNNIYQAALAKNGVDVNTGLFGNITSSDMNALMTPEYKNALNNIALAKLQETQNYHDLMMKYYNDKLEETKKNNAEKIAVANKNADARQTSANASAVRANKSGTGAGKTKKPQDNPDWNRDLADYTARLTNPNYAAQKQKMKAIFIQKHGVDPDKYIKL